MSRYHKNPEAVSRLSPDQYRVTQRDGTERPFENAYWDNKEPGIYVDVVSGEPLFGSIDKFDSSSGSPSFTKPIEPENVIENRDDSHGMIRSEIRSNHGGSHLGHVFPDGPSEAGGLRYCINSASLRLFISITWKAKATASSAKLFEAQKEQRGDCTAGRVVFASCCRLLSTSRADNLDRQDNDTGTNKPVRGLLDFLKLNATAEQ